VIHFLYLMSFARRLIAPQRTSIIQRSFTSTRRAMVGRLDLSISAHQNEQQVVDEVTQLVDNGRWHLCVGGGAGLERQFKFRTFKATWVRPYQFSLSPSVIPRGAKSERQDFMNEVASECKKQKHHPEWTNVFNRTNVRWTTHSPKGMSVKDTHMARFCDEAAERHGEQYPDPTEAKMEGGGAIESGDCCGQKEGKVVGQ